MAADAAAVSLCGRIARPPFLAFVGATGPESGWPSGPKPSGAFRHAWYVSFMPGFRDGQSSLPESSSFPLAFGPSVAVWML